MNMDGSNLEIVYTNTPLFYIELDDNIVDFMVEKNTIYFKSSSNYMIVYKYDINNNNLLILNEDVNVGTFVGDYLYYIDHNERTFSIFKQSVSIGNINLIRGSGQSYYNVDNADVSLYDGVLSVEDEIYYTTRFPTKIYKYNDCSEDKDEIIGEVSNIENKVYIYMFANNKKLYYAYNSSGVGYLFSYTSKTNETVLISEIKGFRPDLSFAVFGDVLFYYEYDDINFEWMIKELKEDTTAYWSSIGNGKVKITDDHIINFFNTRISRV